jgi:hypothetical protein
MALGLAAGTGTLLAQFDPQGLAQALGEDEEHANWFELVCATLLPDYAFSLGWHYNAACRSICR